MPENLFFGVGTTTSIFLFESGIPQNNKNIIGYYIEEDGLETVKNQGRQDVKNRWESIEEYWIQAIHDGNEPKYGTRQIIKPSEHLSYQMPEEPFEVYEDDFMKAILDYEMFQSGINVKELGEKLLKKVMYSSDIRTSENTINISIKDEN